MSPSLSPLFIVQGDLVSPAIAVRLLQDAGVCMQALGELIAKVHTTCRSGVLYLVEADPAQHAFLFRETQVWNLHSRLKRRRQDKNKGRAKRSQE